MKILSCEHLSGRLRSICEGSDETGTPIDLSPDKRLEYLKALFPKEEIDVLINHLQNQQIGVVPTTGLGDIVAKGIKLATFGLVKPCGPCKRRQEMLNKIKIYDFIPFLSPKEITHKTRKNMLMHIWPTSNNAWKWNIDQIIQRKELFTGKIVIGVAEGHNTCSLEEVKQYAAPLKAELFSVPNNPRIREGATFVKLLEHVQDDKDSITFFCHGKGARHGDAFVSDGSTLKVWTETMYKTCLDDMDLIINQLKTSCMTGPFRRFGNFKTPGNHRWHYSGAFYWFRNSDVFERNWRKIDLFFFAVESWPGLMFKPEEVACCFHDNCGDLYKMDYWNSAVLSDMKTRGI